MSLPGKISADYTLRSSELAQVLALLVDARQLTIVWRPPGAAERAFPCPRTWEFASNIVKNRNGLDPLAERALLWGTVGKAAAVEFAVFLKVWRELPHPRVVLYLRLAEAVERVSERLNEDDNGKPSWSGAP